MDWHWQRGKGGPLLSLALDKTKKRLGAKGMKISYQNTSKERIKFYFVSSLAARLNLNFKEKNDNQLPGWIKKNKHYLETCTNHVTTASSYQKDKGGHQNLTNSLRADSIVKLPWREVEASGFGGFGGRTLFGMYFGNRNTEPVSSLAVSGDRGLCFRESVEESSSGGNWSGEMPATYWLKLECTSPF